MHRLYEPPAYDAASASDVFWNTGAAMAPDPPVTGDTQTEFAIIGAGFTGLNAALVLARDHGAAVTVLDAQTVGFGASGRNGGFCCIGGARASDRDLRKRFGPEALAHFHKAQRAAIDHVADLLQTHGIEADRHSEGETLLAHRPRDIERLEEEAAALSQAHGVTARVVPRAGLAELGLGGPGFHGALTSPLGFALHPGKYVRGLAAVARQAGVDIHANSPVLSVDPTADGRLRLTAPTGSVTARKVLVATNGYSSEDVPGWMASRYLPVQSSVLVTRPLSAEEQAEQGWTSAQMAYDTRRLLHYFRRMPDGRFLFGMRGGVRADQRAQAAVARKITSDFHALFPAWRHVEITHIWSGFVCMTPGLLPFAGALPASDGVFAAYGYHGNGVAMGSYTGALVAGLMAGDTSAPAIPRLMTKPPGTFPLGRWRRALLPLANGWYALQDRG